MLDPLAAAILASSDSAPVRLMFGTGTGVNTVTIDGSTTAVTLPAISSITTGDYVAILAWGSDRLILGAIT